VTENDCSYDRESNFILYVSKCVFRLQLTALVLVCPKSNAELVNN